MGSSSSKKNTNKLIIEKEIIQINKQIKINEPIKMTESENKKDRVKECIIEASPHFEKKDFHLSDISKSICKIKIEAISETMIGTGFLLKFYINQEIFYCLVSNEKVIKNDIIQNNNNIIYISYDNEFKNTNIKLGNKKRYMKSFTDIELDITVVEVMDEDNISKDYFLFPDFLINNELINNNIYTIICKGERINKFRGIIKEINKNEFTYLPNTEKGSSGSPIFLENSIYVIGIHKEGNKDKTENYGDFIYPAINIIKKDMREKRKNGKYINGKYIWENGKYYIGEFKNNIPNGKGIKYYSNGNINYEGDFINGKYEGNGKNIYENGELFKLLYLVIILQLLLKDFGKNIFKLLLFKLVFFLYYLAI